MATITTNAFDYTAPAVTETTKRKPSFAKRFWAALQASREAAARREIARHSALIAGLSQSKIVNRDELPF